MQEVTNGQRLHRTIWYMGAKSRVIPGFLDAVLEEELAPGDTLVDLMSGSGAVSAFAASRYRVLANDVQLYSSIIARSLIEHSPESKEAFLSNIQPEADLQPAFRGNCRNLAAHFREALGVERELLEEFGANGGEGTWPARYRAYLEQAFALDPGSAVPAAAPLYAGAERLFSSRELERRRRDPRVRPACLATVLYANIYFGLEQAIAFDSLRAAIDELDPAQPFYEAKRVHYLSALLHAASISTSGTSHFAQPRHLTKDSELRAMARRRQVDVWSAFCEESRSIAEMVREIRHRPRNRVFTRDYRDLVGADGSFGFPEEVQLVYLDPPYTADNYSRFYHVLEVLSRYDYPELERRGGQVVRGRYPAISSRFQSDFCRLGHVEAEFRRVARASAAAGAKLVISYAWPTGLLLKRYARDGSTAPVERLAGLVRESYRGVRVLRRPMMHSGQGDSNISIEELLVVGTGPRRSC